MKYSLVLLSVLIIGVPSAFAHTTVQVGPYSIEAGWGIEPPIVGIRNNFVFEIAQSGDSPGISKGIASAFTSIDATAKFGGVTKTLDVNSDTLPGHYYSPVIPTKTGSIVILFEGELDGVPINVEIPVEDVETTAVLDFPPKSSSNSDTASLKNAMNALQQDVNDLKSGNTSTGSAYDFAVFGLSLGAAGVILAIIAMVKRK